LAIGSQPLESSHAPPKEAHSAPADAHSVSSRDARSDPQKIPIKIRIDFIEVGFVDVIYITPASGGQLLFNLLYHLRADVLVNREVLSLLYAQLSHNDLYGRLYFQML
jgi:hypothetical protein